MNAAPHPTAADGSAHSAPNALAQARARTLAFRSFILLGAGYSVVLGELMVLFANDVLHFAPRTISALLASMPFVMVGRVLFVHRLARVHKLRLISISLAVMAAMVATLLVLALTAADRLTFSVFMALVLTYFIAYNAGFLIVWSPLLREITTPDTRVEFVARLQFWTGIVNIAFFLALTLLVGRTVTPGRYAGFLGFALLALANAWFWVRRLSRCYAPPAPPPALTAGQAVRHLVDVLRTSPVLRGPLLMSVLFFISISPVFALYQRQLLRIPSNIVLGYTLCFMTGSTLALFFSGKLAHSLGLRSYASGMTVLLLLSGFVLLFAAPLPEAWGSWRHAGPGALRTVAAMLLYGFIRGGIYAGFGVALTTLQLHYYTPRRALEESTLFSVLLQVILAANTLAHGWWLQDVALKGGQAYFLKRALHLDAYKAAYLLVGLAAAGILLRLAHRLPNLQPEYGILDFFGALFHNPIRSAFLLRHAVSPREERRLMFARPRDGRYDPINVNGLIALLGDPSYDVKIQAIRSLAYSRSVQGAAALLNLLKDPGRDYLAEHVIWSLGELRYGPAAPAVRAFCADARPAAIRAVAVRALAKLDPDGSADCIADLLRGGSDDPLLAAACGRALLRSGCARHLGLVIESLARIGHPDGEAELLTALCDPLGIPLDYRHMAATGQSPAQLLEARILDEGHAVRADVGTLSALVRRRDRPVLQRLLEDRARAADEDGAPVHEALIRAVSAAGRWGAPHLLAAAVLLRDAPDLGAREAADIPSGLP